VDRDELEKEVARRAWFHTFEIAPGLHTKGAYEPNTPWLFGQVGLGTELKGKRALDMGCADGVHSFSMAKWGAEVTAVDVYTPEFRNVEFLSQLWNIPVEYKQSTIYEFKAEKPFDLVLALGVFYHLQYPLLGLHCLNQLCSDTLLVESHIRRGWGLSCRFYPQKELGNDPSNWWGPTRKCLLAMLESAGFEPMKYLSHAPGRFLVLSRKVRDVAPAFSPCDVNIANFGIPPY
jgi:tRNA (mo5U34)-methyltransferase